MTPEKTTPFEGPLPKAHVDPAPADVDLVGQTLNGAYHVEARIGAGGMGVVYQATQLALGRRVALKTILPGYQVAALAVERFHREAKVLSRLNHPNIVNVIDFGVVEPGQVHYLVMEYLEGEPLASFVQPGRRLPQEAVLEIMSQLCSGLDAAHRQQVVHRDLKPANVFLAAIPGSHRTLVKILDFGLAKMVGGDRKVDKALTQTGMLMGTLGYTAPEQLQGAPGADHRADIYSLGAILYYVATGQDPYPGDTVNSILVKQLSQPPAPMAAVTDGSRPALERVVHKAMSIDPAARHATAGDFYAELEQVLRPLDTRNESRTPSVVARLPATTAMPPGRSARALWWAAAAVIFGAALVAGGWLLGIGRGDRKGAAPLTATAPGVSETEIVLGMSGPFSGPARELGRAMQLGMECCFQEVNDQGGVHGRKVRLLALDDAYDPKRAAANVDKLLAEPVFALVGNVGTPTSEAALPLVIDKKRLFYGAFTGAHFLRRDPPDRYVFNFRASYAQETAAMVHYLLKVRRVPAEAIAVFAQEDSYGDDGFAGVAKALRKHDFDSSKILRVGYPRNSLDVDKAVRALAARQDTLKAVIMVATYKPAARFIKAMKDKKADLIFSNVSFVGSNALAEELREMGPGYATGVIVTQVVPHFQSNATGVLRFRDMLQKHFPAEEPGFVALEGYLSAQVLVEAMAKAGPNLTPETLVDAFESLRDLDLAVGTLINFAPSNHQGSTKVWGTVLDAGGKYNVMDLE